MNNVNDTRRLQLPQKPVFVDWRGSRRRLVTAVGIAVGVALAGWLLLVVAGVVLAMSGSG